MKRSPPPATSQGYEVVAPEDTLSAFTMDALFQQVATAIERAPSDSRSSRCDLDLTHITFIDPYGMASLHSIGRLLKKRFRVVQFRLPEDGKVRGYLDRMGFETVISPYAGINGKGNRVTPPRQWDESEVLLELTPIRGKADIDRVIEHIVSRVERILSRELGYSKKDITDFMTILSEVCWNINDHSEDEGIAAVQRYQNKRDGSKYVIIGVSDLGIGIRESLGQRFHTADWDDATAIVNALKKEYSRHPQRGLGLYRVRQLIQDFRGSLHIRSGDTRLYLRHIAKFVRSVPSPGTHISISLSERQN